MTLRELLEGCNARAGAALDGLFAALPGGEERISWYPSCGSDFRDLLEMLSPERQRLHGLDEAPNLFIHTDYFPRWVGLKPGVVRQDGRTTVEVLELHDVRVRDGIDFHYEVSAENATFPKDAYTRPVITLARVRVTSNLLGVVEGWVFFFFFENHNFLEEIVLRQGLRITHFVKVREGVGFGGNRKSISVFYALLAHVGVRYLLVDSQVQYNTPTHDRLALRFGISHPAFRLERTGESIRWSEFGVRAFRVIPESGTLSDVDLWQILWTLDPHLSLVGRGRCYC